MMVDSEIEWHYGAGIWKKATVMGISGSYVTMRADADCYSDDNPVFRTR